MTTSIDGGGSGGLDVVVVVGNPRLLSGYKLFIGS